MDREIDVVIRKMLIEYNEKAREFTETIDINLSINLGKYLYHSSIHKITKKICDHFKTDENKLYKLPVTYKEIIDKINKMDMEYMAFMFKVISMSTMKSITSKDKVTEIRKCLGLFQQNIEFSIDDFNKSLTYSKSAEIFSMIVLVSDGYMRIISD